MVDSINIGNPTTKIDAAKWKKLTPQEILREEGNGEDIPAEIVAWAQQMAAFAKIPDNVTYERVDGDVGLDALDKLGLGDNQPAPPDDNTIPPEETETPDAIKDTDKPEALDPENPDDPNIFAAPPLIPPQEPPSEDDTPTELSGLADSTLNTDPEKIRKRKDRKGLPQ